MGDLFSDQTPTIEIAEGAFYYPAALKDDIELIDTLKVLLQTNPTVPLVTPMGAMSSSLTSCGSVGWHSDEHGYRYTAINPSSCTPWPEIPQHFLALAQYYAKQAGYVNFTPNTCLINRYLVGAKMGLHTDSSEFDSIQPVVSLSLGLSATFLFGGNTRQAPAQKLRLNHGDVLVWGNASRHAYHGISHIEYGKHPEIGRQRFNLTFRYVDINAWQQEQLSSCP